MEATTGTLMTDIQCTKSWIQLLVCCHLTGWIYYSIYILHHNVINFFCTRLLLCYVIKYQTYFHPKLHNSYLILDCSVIAHVNVFSVLSEGNCTV